MNYIGYDWVNDVNLSHNLLNTGLPEQAKLELKLKAIVQSYSQTQQANRVHL